MFLSHVLYATLDWVIYNSGFGTGLQSLLSDLPFFYSQVMNKG